MIFEYELYNININFRKRLFFCNQFTLYVYDVQYNNEIQHIFFFLYYQEQFH